MFQRVEPVADAVHAVALRRAGGRAVAEPHLVGPARVAVAVELDDDVAALDLRLEGRAAAVAHDLPAGEDMARLGAALIAHEGVDRADLHRVSAQRQQHLGSRFPE